MGGWGLVGYLTSLQVTCSKCLCLPASGTNFYESIFVVYIVHYCTIIYIT
jgi:hypothetical protein